MRETRDLATFFRANSRKNRSFFLGADEIPGDTGILQEQKRRLLLLLRGARMHSLPTPNLTTDSQANVHGEWLRVKIVPEPEDIACLNSLQIEELQLKDSRRVGDFMQQVVERDGLGWIAGVKRAAGCPVHCHVPSYRELIVDQEPATTGSITNPDSFKDPGTKPELRDYWNEYGDWLGELGKIESKTVALYPKQL